MEELLHAGKRGAHDAEMHGGLGGDGEACAVEQGRGGGVGLPEVRDSQEDGDRGAFVSVVSAALRRFRYIFLLGLI